MYFSNDAKIDYHYVHRIYSSFRIIIIILEQKIIFYFRLIIIDFVLYHTIKSLSFRLVTDIIDLTYVTGLLGTRSMNYNNEI